MKILAFEFSTSRRSVAVLNAGSSREQVVESESTIAPPISEAEVLVSSSSADIPAMIEGALQQAGLEREQINLLAVGLGPGSYTGIRSALALVQGWQLARDIPAIGISSVETIAAEALARGLTGEINVIVDAQRKEFYVARYALNGTVRELESLRIETFEQVQSRERAGEVMIGPELTRWLPGSTEVFPSARSTARLAWRRFPAQPRIETLEPIYLREPSFVKAPPPRVLSEISLRERSSSE